MGIEPTVRAREGRTIGFEDRAQHQSGTRFHVSSTRSVRALADRIVVRRRVARSWRRAARSARIGGRRLVVGGLVGGFVATNLLKIGSVDGVNVESIVIATLGAIAVVFVVNATRTGGLGRRFR